MNRNSEFQSLLSGMRPAVRFGLAALLGSAAAWGATFGTVVPIDIPVGGHVSDIVLDEARGAVYAANFTAPRIEVMSVADKKVTRSIAVPAQPGAMAMSPNGQFLVVTHFGGESDFPLFPSTGNVCPSGAVSIVDLGKNAVQFTACADFPLGVAFGNDGL